MSEIENTTAATEVAAPASTAASTQPDSAAASATAPSTSSPVEAGPGAAASTPEPAQLPEWDVSGWDGKDESVPEFFRPMATGLRDHYAKGWETEKGSLNEQLQKHQVDLEQERKLREALEVAPGTDSRIGEMQRSIEESNLNLADRDKQIAELTSQVQQMQQAEEARLTEQAKSWYEDFSKKYGPVVENEKARNMVADLIDAKIEPDTAVRMVARELGIKLPGMDAPNPAVGIISGARGRPGAASPKSARAFSSYDEHRGNVIDNIFNRSSG